MIFSWKVIGARVLVNLMVLGLLAISAYAVVEVVQRSTHKDAGKSFWRRNEITVVMSLISFLFPMFFEGLGYFEHYHPRKQLRLQLARLAGSGDFYKCTWENIIYKYLH